MPDKTTTSLPVEHLFSAHLTIDPHHIIPNGPEGTKLVAPISGGTVSGERINGTILAHSGDAVYVMRDLAVHAGDNHVVERLLRDIAEGKEKVGDTTTLEDYSILAKLRSDEE